MAKIPFSIDYRSQIESGEYKVETRDGRPVRIICWDLKHNIYPIIALYVNGDNKEGIATYDINGCYCPGENNGQDIFIITPEPELSEFEKALLNEFENIWEGPVPKERAKQSATKLLNLARKEIESEIKEHVVHDYWRHTADLQIQAKEEGYNEALKDIKQDPESSYAFKRGFEYGKEEALNDLPRWKKIGRGNNYSSEVKFAINGRYLEMNDTLNDVYEIKLLDLEKLPGFKED